MTISIRQLTPDDRYWRIDWFGEFAYPPGERKSQPSVRVSISPILCNPEDSSAILATNATNLNKQRQIWLPVGLLGLVKIGDIWRNGQCVISPEFQIEKFERIEIKKETTNFIKAGLPIDEKYLLPLNEHPWHSLQTQSYCLSVMLQNGKRVIIPCVELIRFYFGSSSRLLHTLFTRQMSDENLFMDSQYDPLSGRLHLKLAAGLSGMSAADIGRIALDKNAWNAARLIFDTCQAASVRGEPAYPYTKFPFIGETDLIASGKWLSCGSTPDATFVVYNLRSCSHPFPFASLSYKAVDNKKVGANNRKPESQAQEKQEKRFFVNSVKTKLQQLSDNDPGKSRSNKEFLAKAGLKFPDLRKKPVWRESYDTANPPAVIRLKGPIQDALVSVGEGSYANGKNWDIDVGQQHDHRQIQDIDTKKHKFVIDGIKLAIKQFIFQPNLVVADLITLPGYTHPVISLPYLVDEYGEIHPVSFCSDGRGGERCRRACFVEIREGEKIHCRVFIVEQVGSEDKVRAINVREFDLRRGMEVLLSSEVVDPN